MYPFLCTHHLSWLLWSIFYGVVEGLIVVDAVSQLLGGVERLWRDAYDLGDRVRLLQEEVQDVLNLVCIMK